MAQTLSAHEGVGWQLFRGLARGTDSGRRVLIFGGGRNLPQKMQAIVGNPLLNDIPLLEAQDYDAFQRDGRAGGGDAVERTVMGARHCPASANHVSVRDKFSQNEAGVGERAPQPVGEAGHALMAALLPLGRVDNRAVGDQLRASSGIVAAEHVGKETIDVRYVGRTSRPARIGHGWRGSGDLCRRTHVACEQHDDEDLTCGKEKRTSRLTETPTVYGRAPMVNGDDGDRLVVASPLRGSDTCVAGVDPISRLTPSVA